MPKTSSQAGFSLLEALIALAILAVAAASLIGAAETHVDRIGGLERRTVASWVAEMELAELRIGALPLSGGPHDREMAGQTWRVETNAVATGDPDLIRVDIFVRGQTSSQPDARLSGFVDVGAAR